VSGDVDEKFLFYCATCWQSCAKKRSATIHSLAFPVAGNETVGHFPVGAPLAETKYRWLQSAIFKWTNVIVDGIYGNEACSVNGLSRDIVNVAQKDYKAGLLPPFVTHQNSSVYPVYTRKMYTDEILTHLVANPAFEVSLRCKFGTIQAIRFRAGFSAADALKWAGGKCAAARVGEDRSEVKKTDNLMSTCPLQLHSAAAQTIGDRRGKRAIGSSTSKGIERVQRVVSMFSENAHFNVWALGACV